MFDREGFIGYVGAKNGNSYASGLVRIESLAFAMFTIAFGKFYP